MQEYRVFEVQFAAAHPGDPPRLWPLVLLLPVEAEPALATPVPLQCQVPRPGAAGCKALLAFSIVAVGLITLSWNEREDVQAFTEEVSTLLGEPAELARSGLLLAPALRRIEGASTDGIAGSRDKELRWRDILLTEEFAGIARQCRLLQQRRLHPSGEDLLTWFSLCQKDAKFARQVHILRQMIRMRCEEDDVGACARPQEDDVEYELDMLFKVPSLAEWHPAEARQLSIALQMLWKRSEELLQLSLLHEARHQPGDAAKWIMKRIAEAGPDGLVALTSYNMKPVRILRAWPDRLAKNEVVVLRKSRQQQEAAAQQQPASLVTFHREKHGVEVMDEHQCVVEGADGVCIRALPCHGDRHAPKLCAHLCSECGAEPAASSCSSTGGGKAAASAGEAGAAGGLCPAASSVVDLAEPRQVGKEQQEPGKIRLLPEFLIVHPFERAFRAQGFMSELRFVPVVLGKMERRRKIAGLRTEVYKLLSIDGPPRAVAAGHAGSESERPFQHAAYGSPPRRALVLEGGLRETLLQEAPMPFLSHQWSGRTEIHRPSRGNACVEWILEVAMTTPAACEPYELTRLAWLGDAAIFLLTARLVFCMNPRKGVEWLMDKVASIVSNKRLGCIARQEPLFLNTFLATAPFSTRPKVSSMEKSEPLKKVQEQAAEAAKFSEKEVDFLMARMRCARMRREKEEEEEEEQFHRMRTLRDEHRQAQREAMLFAERREEQALARRQEAEGVASKGLAWVPEGTGEVSSMAEGKKSEPLKKVQGLAPNFSQEAVEFLRNRMRKEKALARRQEAEGVASKCSTSAPEGTGEAAACDASLAVSSVAEGKKSEPLKKVQEQAAGAANRREEMLRMRELIAERRKEKEALARRQEAEGVASKGSASVPEGTGEAARDASPAAATAGSSVSHKVDADAFEALVGAIVLVEGLIGACKLLLALAWWELCGVAAGPLEDCETAPPATTRWLGHAVAKFHATAWLLSQRPDFADKALIGNAHTSTQDKLTSIRRLWLTEGASKLPAELLKELVGLSTPRAGEQEASPGPLEVEQTPEPKASPARTGRSSSSRGSHAETFELATGAAYLAAGGSLSSLWTVLDKVWAHLYEQYFQ